MLPPGDRRRTIHPDKGGAIPQPVVFVLPAVPGGVFPLAPAKIKWNPSIVVSREIAEAPTSTADALTPSQVSVMGPVIEILTTGPTE